MQTVSEAFQLALTEDKPQRALLVFEDGTEFSNEDLVLTTGISITENFHSATDLTIGQCPSYELSFDLWNENYHLDTFNFGKLTGYLGVRIDKGQPTETVTRIFKEDWENRLYAFTPVGVFIANRPDIVHKRLVTVSANDQMTLFDKELPPAATLNLNPTNFTASQLFTAMCQHVGVQYVTNTFLNSGARLTAWPDAFTGATMREALGWIAQLAGSNAVFNRNGLLEFKWFGSTSVKTFDESLYGDFSPAWYATPAISGVCVRNDDATAQAGDTLGENIYLIQNNPFLKPAEPEVST